MIVPSLRFVHASERSAVRFRTPSDPWLLLLRMLRREPLRDCALAARVEQLCREHAHCWRDRLLTPLVTVRLVLLQVLHGNTAITHLRQLSGLCFAPSSFWEALLLPAGEITDVPPADAAEAKVVEDLGDGRALLPRGPGSGAGTSVAAVAATRAFSVAVTLGSSRKTSAPRRPLAVDIFITTYNEEEELVRIFSQEVRGFLDKMDAADLVQQIVSGLVIEMKTETPRPTASGSTSAT